MLHHSVGRLIKWCCLPIPGAWTSFRLSNDLHLTHVSNWSAIIRPSTAAKTTLKWNTGTRLKMLDPQKNDCMGFVPVPQEIKRFEIWHWWWDERVVSTTWILFHGRLIIAKYKREDTLLKYLHLGFGGFPVAPNRSFWTDFPGTNCPSDEVC